MRTNPLAESRHLKLHLIRFPVVCLMLFVAGQLLRGEVKVLRIDPQQTDPSISMVRSPHIALYDPQVAQRHQLFLFLVGTKASTASSLSIDRAFAGWGYNAISLDYDNNVIAVSCAHSLNSACFDNYRSAIVTGAAVSAKIHINPANSILNRFQKLLAWLVEHDPSGDWAQFLHNGQPDWSRVIVAGHSQGAGHAAFIGKLFRVDRVLMFSGPQDYLDDLHEPASWQSRKSATPPSRFFAFLNLEDPFNVHHQIANCVVLMKMRKPRSLAVKPGEVIRGRHQILINDFPTRQHHGSTLFPQFDNVWKYMAAAR